MKRRWGVGLALFVLTLALPVQVNAQTKGIGLSPALQEVTLAPDQASTSFAMRLFNTTDKTTDLHLSTMDFGALDESGGIAFLGRTEQETTVYGLKQWMVLEKDRLTLEPGQSQEVRVTIDNKESLGPGGHYGAVIVTAAEEVQANQDNVAVLPAASTLVLLKKTGGETLQLELDSIKANSSWFALPKSAVLRFKNSGNTHVVPRGTVELYSPTGSLMSRTTINPESSFVLPESFRQFTSAIKLDKQPWLPGRYKTVVNWRWDSQEIFNQTVEYHWYMGKLLLGLIITSSLVIVLILYIHYRRRPVSRGR